MSSSGPNSPATIVDDASLGGDTPWTSPGNAATSNNVYTFTDLGESSVTDYLKCTNFGFSIPAGSTINGIKVEVESYVEHAALQWTLHACIVQSGTIQEASDITALVVDTEAYLTCGSATELWGLTWSVAQVNSANFGVAVKVYAPEGSSTVDIDHVRITVYYSAADGGIQAAQRVIAVAT